MLYLLTGDIQIGKTRWLKTLCNTLGQRDVEVAGVIAPGQWHPLGDKTFDKRGIDNVLLPSGERIAFARRRDLALEEGTLDPASQSAQANLMWEIDETAICRVNDHFRELTRHARTPGSRPGILVVDELGQLELVRGGGLTSAVALLDAGPTPRYPHAIVVVREQLIEHAHRRFDAAWGGAVRAVSPTDQAAAQLLGTVCEQGTREQDA